MLADKPLIAACHKDCIPPGWYPWTDAYGSTLGQPGLDPSPRAQRVPPHVTIIRAYPGTPLRPYRGQFSYATFFEHTSKGFTQATTAATTPTWENA